MAGMGGLAMIDRHVIGVVIKKITEMMQLLKVSAIRMVKGKFKILSLFLLYNNSIISQQVYDDFEGNSKVHYDLRKAGKLDSTASNPKPDKLNPSATCAKYTRSKQQYDNIKMNISALADVPQYATYTGAPKKLKLKIFTNAPVGTLIEIHLGRRTGNAYPEGTHSQYQAFTSVSGKWEELEFKFSQVPQGSKTAPGEVNQVTLMFNPYMNTEEVFYFDDFSGPVLIDSSLNGEGTR